MDHLKSTKISKKLHKKRRSTFTDKTLNRSSSRFSRNTTENHIAAFSFIGSRNSPFPLLQNQKPPFNVFQLLVPKEKIEILVDDTSIEMNSETDREVQFLGVEDKKNERRDTADVILLSDEESSHGKQGNLNKDEPEIVLLDENLPNQLNISDEIICLQDLKIVGEPGPSSSRPQQKEVKEVQSETRIATICDINPGEQSPSYAGLQNFPSSHNLLYSVPSLPSANMPEFVDLLTQGTLLICKKWLRKWDVVRNGLITGKPLRICSYNVLCEQTAYKTPELYVHLAKSGHAYQLTWANRWRLLTREFSMIAADIFCLQEVQYDHYDHFFKPYFEAAGFFGEYKKRTHSLVDGCAVFYKSHFQLLHYEYIEYYVNSESVLDKDHVGQLLRLKDIRSGQEFCVANTHLIFNEWRGDIKLAQLAVLLANIDRECGPDSGQECPYILCGDFNMQPYSPLYNFIINGEICFTNLRRGGISGQGGVGGPFVSVNLLPEDLGIGRNCRFKNLKNRRMLLPPANCWSHPLCFNSVYQPMDAVSAPVVSTYHSLEAANPDFIFYSVRSKGIEQPMFTNSSPAINVAKKEIRLIQRLSLPTMKQLAGTLGPWPNSTTPSDHIPLIADFVLQ